MTKIDIPEILYINKPSGITSFDVIRQLRPVLETRKIGHAGTLDPLASGLLVLGINKGTKKMGAWIKQDKEYEVGILFGKKTETGDTDGNIIEERPVDVDLDKLKKTIENLPGELELMVPKYSAVKQKGTPLYKKARAGLQVKPPTRKMKIYQAKLLETKKEKESAVATLHLQVASGVYVRSIAEYVGEQLGLPATVCSLRRTKIGETSISEALTLDQVKLKFKDRND